MKDFVQIIARHVLTLIAGWLVSKNVTDPANAGSFVNVLLPIVTVLVSLGWSHLHLGRVSNPLPSPKALGLFLSGLLLTFGLGGCTTALQADKIISVKQRCFGLTVETASTANSTPSIKLGFCSTVWQVIPTSTNALFAPTYMDTFDLGQSINPFETTITENTGAGTVMIGTNGEASAFPPPK